MKKSIISLLIAFAVAITIFGTTSVSAFAYNSQCAKSGCTRKRSTGSIYCYEHKSGTSSSSSYSSSKSYSSTTSTKHCAKAGCTRKRSTGSIYCYEHKPKDTSSSSSYSSKSTSKKKSSYSGKSKKSYDYYGVHDYKSAQDFADDKYEEFYDYEDDYEDEDEAYDAAEDYWNDNH